MAHCLSGSKLQPGDEGHPLGVGAVEFVTSDPEAWDPLPAHMLVDAQNSDTFPGSWVSGFRPLPDLPLESGAGDVVIWKEDQRKGAARDHSFHHCCTELFSSFGEDMPRSQSAYE